PQIRSPSRILANISGNISKNSLAEALGNSNFSQFFVLIAVVAFSPTCLLSLTFREKFGENAVAARNEIVSKGPNKTRDCPSGIVDPIVPNKREAE
ncbi:hypothetical protein AVEN_140523-1, partial [Araneus ventricosus]